MKKIIGGILGIFLVIGIVAGTGYALFTDQVRLTGIVLGTATPNLEFSLDTTTWSTEAPIGNVFAPLLPGEYDWGELWLRNTSVATTDPLNFNLAARLTSASGDWGVLSDAIQMRVCLYDAVATNHCDTANATSWMTLTSWNAASRTLPGNPLLQGTSQHYAIVFYIDSSYTSTISGKTITDMVFEVTGTQVL